MILPDEKFSLSSHEVLQRGHKFRPAIKTSRLDIVVAVNAVGSRISGEKEIWFWNQELKVMNSLVGASYRLDSVNFEKIRPLKSELMESKLVLLEADKTGNIAVF